MKKIYIPKNTDYDLILNAALCGVSGRSVESFKMLAVEKIITPDYSNTKS